MQVRPRVGSQRAQRQGVRDRAPCPRHVRRREPARGPRPAGEGV